MTLSTSVKWLNSLYLQGGDYELMTEEQWLDIFGDKLSEMIYYAGYSQSEFAQRIGVSEATLSKYINKIHMPSVKAIVNIAYALHCNIEDLVDFGYEID